MKTYGILKYIFSHKCDVEQTYVQLKKFSSLIKNDMKLKLRVKS